MDVYRGYGESENIFGDSVFVYEKPRYCLFVRLISFVIMHGFKGRDAETR